MTSNENWMQRLRDLGRQKPVEEVQITGRYEKMTSTQACRYQELSNLRLAAAQRRRAAPLPDKPYYSLAEAGTRLSMSEQRLLERAGRGDVRCYTNVAGLEGKWQPAPPANGTNRAQWLAVPVDACRDIASYGSANVAVLELRAEHETAKYELDELLWVDSGRLALKHPLPRG